MLPTKDAKKAIIAALAAGVAVCALYRFAVADVPVGEDESSSTSNQSVRPSSDPTPAPPVIPGWVQKEIHIRMPMLVPEGMPIMPPIDSGFAPPFLPDWVEGGMPVPPAGFPFAIDQATPESADPGSLKVKRRRLRNQAGGEYLLLERTWTKGGVLHRDLTLIDPSPEVSLPNQTQPAAESGTAAPKQRRSPGNAPGEPPTQAQNTRRSKQTPSPQNPDAPQSSQRQLGPQQSALPLEPMEGVELGGAVDSQQPARIDNFRRGSVAGASQPIQNQSDSDVQIQSGLGETIGVGVSTDGRGRTRVYRYWRGRSAANAPSPPKAASPSPRAEP